MKGKVIDMNLQKNVIIGHTDVSASSNRALLGLKEATPIEVPSEQKELFSDLKPSCIAGETESLYIWDCPKHKVTVIVINSVIDDNKLPTFLNKLMDICSQSKVDRIYIPTVLRVELPSEFRESVYEDFFHGPGVFKLKSLPDDTRISDPFIITLMQLIQIEGIPTSCLIVPGYRARLGEINDEDGSLPSVKLIQKILTDKLALSFCLETSQQLVYRGNNAVDDDPVSVMYS